ncbi:MAG: DUF401 family protein [Tissierellaceae bacterium]|nr:DUF401 family protein [Tissierellaceae bacterium]
MREFIAVIISFSSIPLLTKKKLPIGAAIWVCAFILSIISGLGIITFFDVIIQTLTDINRIKQYIIIVQIGILGVLLKKYNFIDEIVESLTKVVKNVRIILMFIPALIGLLVVPGGAIISAPFIDQIGEDNKISKTERGVINLIFRHISMHVMPYSNGLLITALLVPQISIYSVIGFNLIFVTIYCILAYFLYIRKIEKIKVESKDPVLPNLIKLLKYTSPIYIAVILNLFFDIPFYIGLIANFAAVYILKPSKEFFKDVVSAINPKVLLAIIGVYLIQNIMSRMDYLNSFLLQIFSNKDTIMFGIIVSSLFFGITTGLSYSSLGIVLPILTQLALSHDQLILFTHFAFVWGFVGYYFSPLHLCQLFTCEYLGIKTSELYKEYKKFIILIIITLILMYYMYSIFIN